MNRIPGLVWYVLFAVMSVLLMRDWWVESRAIELIPYSEFAKELAAGNVKSVAIRDDTMEGVLNKPTKDGKTRFVTNRVAKDVVDELSGHGVEYGAIPTSNWFSTVLSWVAPALVFVLVWMFFAQRMGKTLGPMVSLGKSKAKVYVETNTKVTFNDVAGLDEAKEELRDIVSFLKDPKTATRLGARLPKGVLLVGPPGTGKTLFARAIAGESGVPFYSINGSEFVELFVGLGAARVRDLFEQARQTAPCIIFIDELDALGRARQLSPIGGHEEKEQTLNQLLVEMDGFDPSQGIILLAATNRPEILDPALLRAGRFDRHVMIDRPDQRGRVAILKVHVKKVSLATDVDLEQIAALTIGFCGADIETLVNEAAILATRDGAAAVGQQHFVRALERIVGGLERKSRLLSEKERRVVAFHEAGHAIVATALPDIDPVQKITIIPRGIGALGYTMQRPSGDKYLSTRSELKQRLTVLLGGRTAEQIVFGEISTGAADDLQRAAAIARDMVVRFGMSDALGNLVFTERPPDLLSGRAGELDSSEDTRERIDAAVERLIVEAGDLARTILTLHRTVLDQLAGTLLTQESVEGDSMPKVPKYPIDGPAKASA
jgi:cell division protease FtsH